MLEPSLPSKASQDAFVEHARALAKVCRGERTDEAIEKARGAFVTKSRRVVAAIDRRCSRRGSS
jgi:hypothetical protein